LVPITQLPKEPESLLRQIPTFIKAYVGWGVLLVTTATPISNTVTLSAGLHTHRQARAMSLWSSFYTLGGSTSVSAS
jgi:hypothetical protein